MTQSTMTSQSQNSSSSRQPRRIGRPRSIIESELYHRWYDHVPSGPPNDYVIAITAHPGYTSTSGTGKTTLAWNLAHTFNIYGEWSAEELYTVDLDYLNNEMYQQSDQGDVLVGDEMQGTLANPNFNKKRFMTSEALEGYAAIAGNRKNRQTIILVFQTLKQVNADLFDFVDSWLLIVNDKQFMANHYDVVPNVFDLNDRSVTTPYIETITWDDVPDGDEDYRVMEQKKDQANRGEQEYDEEEEEEEEEGQQMSKEQQAHYAKRIREAEDCAWKNVPEHDDADALTYSGSYLRRIYKDVAERDDNRKRAEE